MKASNIRSVLTVSFASVAMLILAVPAYSDYTVTGRFVYEDRAFTSSGFTGATDFRPIRFADVEIVSGNTSLGKGATRADGTFSIVAKGNTAQAIVARCFASSTQTPGLLMEIRYPYYPALDGSGWIRFFDSRSVNSSGTGTVAMGTIQAPFSFDEGKIFNIWDTAYDGMEFVSSVSGNYPQQKLTILWRSDGDSRSFYWGNRIIHIAAQSGYDDTVIAHQFGHFLAGAFSILDNPVNADLTFGDANQDIRTSWAEGVGMFIGASIRKFKGYARPDVYLYTDRLGVANYFEIESLTGSATLRSTKGSTNALAVCAALWDITDGADSEDGSPGVDDDSLQRPFADVWKVLTRYMPSLTGSAMSIESFWDGWFDSTINNGAHAEMRNVFAGLNGIEFIADAQESDDTPAAAPAVAAAPLSPASGPKVVINEIDPGDSGVIELFNAGDTEADLAGWTIMASRSGKASARLDIPSYKLKPGAFVVLAGSRGVNRRAVLYFDLNVPIPWASGADGACALRDSSGSGRDFVRWGDSKEFPPGGTGFAGPNAPSPSTGQTLGRNYAGADTNSGSDWTVQSPTPGTFNAGGPERHHTYYPAGDVDYTAFNAAAGRTYVLETINLKGGADTVLELLSGDGVTVLAASDDQGPGKGSRIVWTAASAGKFLLRSRRFDGPINFARYGAYDLRIIESSSSLPADQPDTLTVSKSGQGGTYKTISDAVKAAGNGDTIQIIDSENYGETLAITGKSVTLKAAGGKKPVLDGSSQSSQPVLSLSDVKTAKIDGLTILGGLLGIRVGSGSVQILNASVANSSGAGIGVYSKAFARVANSVVSNNPVGIVVYDQASATILNSVVRNNGTDGIQIVKAGTSANIVNNTIVNNGRAGVGVFEKASASIVNSIVRNNPTVDVGGDGTASSLTVRNSLVARGGFAGKDGNMDGDPKFVNGDNADFRLQKDSPCIDKGDAGISDLPATDADGVPRSLDGNGDGISAPDMGAYEYVPAGILTSAAVFPQIAVGGPAGAEYKTAIFGMNTGSQAVIANLSLTRSDGTPLPVNVTGASGSSFSLVLQPGATARFETAASGATVSGYAKFASSLPIGGSALFKILNGTSIKSEAGVGLSKPTKNFTVYVDNLNSAISGYAVANPGPFTANLTLTLRNKSGEQVDVLNLSIAPGRHFAKFAFEHFPGTASNGFEGSIEFASDQEVSAVALRYDNPEHDVFSTIPVLVDEAAAILYFPQLADGGGYRTNFILVNPGTEDTAAVLEFFDSNGTALSLSIGGQAKTTHQVEVKAKGVARLVTDGASPNIKVGWARVSAHRPIGGSSIFQTVAAGRITSEAGVSSSRLATRFMTYVESLDYAESGLAIANPNNAEATIILNLRDSEGNVSAATTFKLPPMGHVAKFFTGEGQWFPGYDDFAGTLEVIASAPVSGVALRYDNYEANVFATLPVAVIP